MDDRLSLAAIRRGYLELSAAVAKLAEKFSETELVPYYVRLGKIRRSLDEMGDMLDSDPASPGLPAPESSSSAAPRKRLKALANSVFLAKLDVHIERASALLKQQRARVKAHRLAGVVSNPSLELLVNMTRSVELLHWQRALVLWAARDSNVNAFALQISASAGPPPNVLALICAELNSLQDTGAPANDAADAATNTALRKAHGPRG